MHPWLIRGLSLLLPASRTPYGDGGSPVLNCRVSTKSRVLDLNDLVIHEIILFIVNR